MLSATPACFRGQGEMLRGEYLISTLHIQVQSWASMSSTLEHVRNKEPQAPLQTCRVSTCILPRSQVTGMHVNVWKALFTWITWGSFFCS